MNELARRIKKDMRSLTVKVRPDCVVVKPVFQNAVEVRTWEEYQEHVKAGHISATDAECAW